MEEAREGRNRKREWTQVGVFQDEKDLTMNMKGKCQPSRNSSGRLRGIANITAWLHLETLAWKSVQ